MKTKLWISRDEKTHWCEIHKKKPDYRANNHGNDFWTGDDYIAEFKQADCLLMFGVAPADGECLTVEIEATVQERIGGVKWKRN